MDSPHKTEALLKLIFMGSAAFAVPSLIGLCSAGHEVALVITQPDKPAGRGRKTGSPPVAERARAMGLPLCQPESLKEAKVIEKMRSIGPDVIVIVAYGKLLPKEILAIPAKGCINLHASLLPKYRGASPINRAIAEGETETGVTTMFINPEMDAGDILLKKSLKIEDSDTGVTLHNKLAPLGAALLQETLAQLASIRPEPQDHKKATFAPLIKKEDGLIDWNRDASSIRNLIRGMQPWPSAYSYLGGKMLRIFDAAVIDAASTDRPGTVHVSGDSIIVATGRGKLSIRELQLEGKRRMSARDFLNGHKITSGAQLGQI